MDRYAHTPKNPDDPWELLLDHLLRVAARAEGFAAALLPGSNWAGAWARALGLLHDAGKYADAFQRLLKGEKLRVDHSTAGAVFALQKYGETPAGWLLAYAVAGHHAGLPDGDGDDGSLAVRLRKARIDGSVHDDFMRAIGPLLPAELPVPALSDWFAVALFARMLFSCLTDADALATEGYTDPETAALRGGQPDLATLAAALRLHLAGKAAGALPSPVNAIRAEVLERCRSAADLPPGLFSLAVPTGGGKTLSSLSFALEHALRHGLRRVVYVIPYLSIIEQTAQTFRRDAFAGLPGAVLEHHSAYGPAGGVKDGEEGIGPDRHKLAAENWDSPVTVTTAVQFFESFFAARPSRCRKLHNVARSVIVLDEAQLLPLPHLRPCLALLEALARDYGCTVLLSTATQPALDKDRPLAFGLSGIRPIMPEPGAPALHKAMRRVAVEHAGLLDDEALAGRIADPDQALCVLDTRGHAADLYRGLKDEGVDGLHHLSAAMCAEHRSTVLAGIRADLEAKRPCRVVSTQLVEAGVDVDFPLVLRAMAGLDSIAQAAGRCNREGRLCERGELGRVLVFDTERRNGLSDLNRRRDITREIMDGRPWAEALDPEVLSLYFRRLYGTDKRKRTLDGGDPYDVAGGWRLFAAATRCDALPFRSVAAAFHLIDNEQVAVITPYTEEADRWAAALQATERPGSIARKLQRYTVTIPRGQASRLMGAGVVRAVGEQGQFLLLTDLSYYDAQLGLMARDPRDRTELENIT